MKKMLRALSVSAVLMFSATGASAANTVNLIGAGNHYTGTFTASHASAFTDEFVFLPSFSDALVSASLITIGFSATEDIDFTSVTLNGTPLTRSPSGLGVDTAYTVQELLLNGPFTLVVTGTSGSNASYAGTINLTVVPEPETFALLVAGLGVVGFVTRRRRQAGLAA